MLETEFNKEEGLVAKILQTINKFIFSFVQLKITQKNLGIMKFESDEYNHQKESLNAWLHLEHNKNLALMELQRQRAT